MSNIWNLYASSTVFPLPKISEGASWTFRSPTFRDETEISRSIAGKNVLRGDVIRLELAHTFKATTIPSELSVDADGNPITDPTHPLFMPLIPKDAPVEVVLPVIDSMPPQLVEDLWLQVKTVAPNWGEVVAQ